MTYDKAKQKFEEAQKALDGARQSLNSAKDEAEQAKQRQHEAHNGMLDVKASFEAEEVGADEVKASEKAHKQAEQAAETAAERVEIQQRVFDKRKAQLQQAREQLHPIAWQELRKKAAAEYESILKAVDAIKEANQNLQSLQNEMDAVGKRPVGRIVPRNGIVVDRNSVEVTPSVFRDALQAAETETQ